MANQLRASFAAPLDSFSINLTLENQTKCDIVGFGISGRTSKFPITWDSFGVFGGPANVVSTVGVDTEVVFLRFQNFGPGDSVTFSGIDPDFTGDVSSGVRVGDIAGGRIVVLFSDGTTGFGEFVEGGGGILVAEAAK